jgi:hypothetical protein
MTKKIGAAAILLLILLHTSAAQDEPDLIVDIGLLGGPRISRPTPPTRLNLGVELVRAAHSKLFFGNRIIDAGPMIRGFNVVPLDVTDFFQSSGTYGFVLELKDTRGVSRHELTLTVQMDEKVEKPSAEPKPPPVSYQEREYSLSMYVDQQLVAVSRKKAVGKITFDAKIPRMPRNYDPFNPDAHRDPKANTVSILDALGLAAKMAGTLFKKKEEQSPASTLRPLRQIQVDFRRRTASDREEPVSATVTLKIQ